MRLWLNKGSTYEANVSPREEICMIKHGLRVPAGAESYATFSKNMKANENAFRQEFYNNIAKRAEGVHD